MPGVIDGLAELLRLTRHAEVDLFGGLDPAVRDAPMRPGDWSPKDVQAHLTAWKARQANRISAVRQGTEDTTPDGETDELNAQFHSARADWSWEAIVQEADEVGERLIRELSGLEADAVPDLSRLVNGTFGNGPFHALTHFSWVLDAGVPLDADRLAAFASQLERGVRDLGLADADAGTALYNIACFHALAGRLDEARSLLRVAFAKRPDLAEYSLEDDDLRALRDELPSLAGTQG
jgi:hypothetical protein